MTDFCLAGQSLQQTAGRTSATNGYDRSVSRTGKNIASI